MKRSSSSIAAALIVALLRPSASAQEPTLRDVLARAADYIVEFQRQLSGIVAEEEYVQDTGPSALGGSFNRQATLPQHRELRSDLLLVRPAGVDRWIQFRDVFEVDGHPVRDRTERLMKLFLDPPKTLSSQAEQIADESSRYNIGNLQRTVNVPVLALVILDRAVQPRFRFKRLDKSGDLGVRMAQPAHGSLWILEYQEVERQTIIRTTMGRDMPARGRFWIEADTGRVLASEFIGEDISIRGAVDVGYDVEPSINLLVPVEMRERYDVRRDGAHIEGKATYSKFRQFQVKVDEKIAPIVK